MKKILIITVLLTNSLLFGQVDSTYYKNCSKILERFPKSRITAEDLYFSAKEIYEKDSILVPLELVIAQGLLETSLGTTGVGKERNNPFSINSKKGYIRYSTIREGVLAYYKLISSKYLRCRTLNQLLTNFVNCTGKRYAVSRKYEVMLRKKITLLRKYLY